MTRALLVAPGRGSYSRDSLGGLTGRAPELLDVCDGFRAARGRPTVRALDGAEAYRSSLHVAGENASLLTFACSMSDAHDLSDRFDIVGVVGNSMGFYTALALAGALSLDDAVRLVDTMGAYQTRNVIGGQLLYPMSDGDWKTTPELRSVVEQALADVTAAGHVAEWSIELGGYAVLGADRPGVKALLAALPPVERGSRTFPLQLPLHSAFHTSLMQATSERAFEELGDLPFQAPRVPLIDGRGQVFRPRWSDPVALRDYTLGHQVVRPFDFTRAIETALAYCAPDVVIALGPGNGLGGPLARTLVHSHWRGVLDRNAFENAQASEHPLLLSFGLPDQRDRLT